MAEAATQQGLAGGGGGDRATAETLLQQGLDHYDREELEQAYSCYHQAVTADPNFALAYNNLGMVLIDLEHYDQALESLVFAIRLAPEYGEAYNNLGFALRRLNRHPEAASAYTRFLQLEPEVEEGPRIQEWISQVIREQGLAELPPLAFLDGAEAKAAAAPADEPVPAPAPAEQAPQTASAQMAENEEFEEISADQDAAPAAVAAPPPEEKPKQEPAKIKKMAAWEAVMATPQTAAPVSAFGEVTGSAATAAPASVPAAGTPAAKPAPPAAKPARGAQSEELVGLVERGMDLFAEDRLDEAAQAFRQALEADPQLGEAHTGLGKVLIRQEHAEAGIKELEAAIAVDPSDPAPYYVLGFAFRASGKNAEAAEAYTKFLKYLPHALDSEKISQWIQHVRSATGNEASRSSAAAISVPSGAPAAATSTPAAAIAPEAGLPAEDLSVLAEIGDQKVLTEADKGFQKALHQFQDGDMDEALRTAVKVLTEDPAHFRSRVLLGRIHLRQKQYPKAIEQLEGALVTSPEFPEALYFLGQAFEKSGNHEKASDTYQRCLKVAPQGPRAERLREWLTTQTLHLGKGTAAQTQCELCLRLFPSGEVKEYDGKMTCKGCLALIGGVPITGVDGDPLAAQPSESEGTQPAAVDDIQPPRGGARGLVLVGVLVALLAGIGGAWQFSKLPETLGLRALPVAPIPIEPVPDPTPTPTATVFDGSKVALDGAPPLQVLPWARWSFLPKLSGLDGAPKELKVTYSLKKGPEGMSVDAKTGAMLWNPIPKNPENYLAGISQPVELLVTGTEKTEKEEREVFPPFTRPFVLNCQFGFLPGKEIDLGILPEDRVVITSGDFNGDKRQDVALAKGRFSQGSLRFYFQSADNPFPSPLVVDEVGKSKLGQVGALRTADLDGDGLDDLLTVNASSGKLSSFLQNKQRLPVPGPGTMAGLGPVSLAAEDVDGDGKLDVAVLLGLGRKVVLFRFENGERFSEPKSVEVAAGGPQGWIFPWRSEGRGPGFLAITPLATNPLNFISWKNSTAGTPVSSSIEAGQMIAGAAVIRSALPLESGQKPPQRLALLTNSPAGTLWVFDERDGSLAPSISEKPLPMNELALAMAPGDFNLDGLDDLVVVFESGVRIFFRQESGFVEGLKFANLGRLDGSVAVADLNTDGRPDVLVLTETKKVRVLMSKVAQAPPPAPDAAPAPAGERKPGVPGDAKSTPSAGGKSDTADPKTSK